MKAMLPAICVVLWLALSPGFAQSSQPMSAPPSPGDASIHAYGDRDKTCQAWTDQCRTCARAADDAVNCSNIGIACQPAEITCTSRPAEPPK